MKHHSRILNALLCMAISGSMLSAFPASAEAPPMYRVADVIALQKYLHGKQAFTEEEFHFYDMNQDGIVNIFDLISVKRYVLKDIAYQESKTEFRTDKITAYRDMVWLMGIAKKPVIITSAQQLDQNMNSLFRPEVVRALTKRYDAEFFQEHDLVLDFQIQGADTHQLSAADFSMTEDTINIEYVREFTEDADSSAILLAQFAIPKITHQYDFNITIQNETPLDYEFVSDLDYHNDDYPAAYPDHDQLIESYEAYQNNKKYFPAELQNYSEDFFEDHVLYRYFRPYQAVAERQCYSVMKSGNQITVYTIQRNQVTDFLTSHTCDYLILNRSDFENAEISVKTVNTNSNFQQITPAGDTFYYNLPYDPYDDHMPDCIAVNYNVFNGERQLTFYRVSNPSGMIQYDRWEELMTVEYNAKNPFSETYEEITDADGNKILKGDKFEITTNTIRYPDENGEMIEISF